MIIYNEINKIIQAGATLDYFNNQGNTGLHKAASSLNIPDDIFNFLVANFPDHLKRPNRAGITPIGYLINKCVCIEACHIKLIDYF